MIVFPRSQKGKALALAAALVAMALMAARLEAKPFAETGAPPELAPWVPWVLYGQAEKLCPSRGEGRQCVWPVRLRIVVDRDGGTFEGVWEVRAESPVRLPGQSGAWPTDVTVTAAGTGTIQGVVQGAVQWAAGLTGGGESAIPVTGNQPTVWLKPGRHAIKGRFSWKVRPKTLTLPLGPVLDITVSGAGKPFPVLDENRADGTVSLWLDDKPAEGPAEDGAEAGQNGLRAQIDRLIVDTQPMTVITRVRLTVSGGVREELVREALLADTVPTSMDSPLPARLTGEGLRVQVSPGVHDVYVQARAGGRTDRLGPVGNLYGPETWTFVQQPTLRQVEVSGAPQVDPTMVELPWGDIYGWSRVRDDDGNPMSLKLSSLPIYQLEPGEALSFVTLRRGDPEPGPDILGLRRTCWLDYDGAGLTCRDRLRVSMSRSSHLAVEPPFALGQVSLNGVPQVISWQVDSRGERVPGIQLRQGSADLEADIRLEPFPGTLPASGWDQSLYADAQRFHLPPGYELFYAGGANVFDSNGFRVAWWDRWSNLDLFIVLAIVITAFKLLGFRVALLAAVTMALSYHVFLAPRLVFLHVLGATALLSVLPGAGKARFVTRAWRLIASIFLVGVTASFIITQARVAFYPQLYPYQVPRHSFGYPFTSYLYSGDRHFGDKYASDGYLPPPGRTGAYTADIEMGESAVAPTGEAYDKGYAATYDRRPRPRVGARSLAKGVEARQNSLAMVAPEAMAQNTLARPDWDFTSFFIDYNGQVAKDQTVRLIFIEPWLSSLLCLLRVALMSWLVLAVISAGGAVNFGGLLGRLLPRPGLAKTAKAAATVAVLAMAFSPQALADEWRGFPPPETLNALQNRLLEPEGREGVAIPTLALSSPGPGLLRLSLTIHGQRENVVALPSLDPRVFQPTAVMAEGQGELPILAAPDGTRLALVPAGIQTVHYEGRLAGVDNFQLSFPRGPLPGGVGLTDLPGWSLAGLDQNGHPTSPSVFVYTGREPAPQTPHAAAAGPPAAAVGGEGLKPFFRVERTISLGIEWKVYTTVTPFDPILNFYVLRVPLMPGEKPTTAGLTVRDGEATLSFNPGSGPVSWESDLAIDSGKPIAVTAGSGPYSESWTLDAANFWRVETSGLTPVYNISPSGFWNPKWRPWPGESVSFSVSRPEPIPGRFLVADEATLNVYAGEENRRNELTLTVRSSLGGPFAFDLPAGSEIQTLSMDGQNLPSSSVSGPRVALPLTPGEHGVTVEWLETKSLGPVVRIPELNLDLAAANIKYSLRTPGDRWTLFAGGPVQGPAVLFWSMAGAILVFSLFLGRLKFTPLGTVSWFLLFLGLAQLSPVLAFIVAGWLLVFGLRGTRDRIGGNFLFKVTQIALVVWTALALWAIYQGLRHGLLEAPVMRVTGYGSTDHNLRWFVDRASGAWPGAWALTIPDRFYGYAMLAWALWLAVSLIRWMKWLWRSFSHQGFWAGPKAAQTLPPPSHPGGWSPPGPPPGGDPAGEPKSEA
ncbi:MAG: hypothetical protein LBF58_03510 [Deltaproteobacteria bacterium]|jgi:hypothetical protein|nr:hypothetical protein [Deltaproteobacteria bacterium]